MDRRLYIEANIGIDAGVSAVRLTKQRLAGDVEFMLVVPVDE